MAEEINAREALCKTPRPHYLIGKAMYEQNGSTHILRGTVNFNSENPSIHDRTDKYLPNPHVNVGDVCFAVWNAAHIIGDRLDYTERTLVDEIRIIPKRLIPPDTPLDFEVRVTEGERRTDRNKRPYHLGTVEGRLSLDNKLLTEVYAKCFARKE